MRKKKKRNRGLIPSPGTKIPNAVGQLSLSITTTEPDCYNNLHAREPVFHNRRRHLHEKPMHNSSKADPAHCNYRKLTCILSIVKQITSPGGMHETSARAWCTGKTQGNRVEREVGGGIGMGEYM